MNYRWLGDWWRESLETRLAKVKVQQKVEAFCLLPNGVGVGIEGVVGVGRSDQKRV